MSTLSRAAARIFLLLPCAAASGVVVVDHSFNKPGPIPGPNYSIDANYGRRVGPNLFHSFSTFDLAKGETATFSSHVPVKNVLARVTGGSASTINGTLRSTIPGANFYLMNPAGVIFGPDAKLDLKGSFAVTTADEIQLRDGGKFKADPGSGDILSTAPPAAFGFLAQHPKSINIGGDERGPSINTSGHSLRIVGGDVTINASTFETAGGNLVIVSAISPAKFDITSLDAGAGSLNDGKPSLGKINVRGSILRVDGNASGAIVIRSGDLKIVDSSLLTDGGALELYASRAITIDSENPKRGAILTSAYVGDAPAQPIEIDADELNISRTSDILSANSGAGNGADVQVHAKELSVNLGAKLLSVADAGNAGNIDLHVTHLFMDGILPGTSLDTVPTPQDASLISSVTTGFGGDITIKGSSVRISNGAVIETAGANGGYGGDITIMAKHSVLLRGNGALFPGGVFAQSSSQGFLSFGGGAGDITIKTARIEATDGALINDAATSGTIGGDIFISARDGILFDGQRLGDRLDFEPVNPTIPSGVEAGADPQFGGGLLGSVGGNITLKTHGLLQISRGAAIIAGTGGKGNGGSLTIEAGRVLIDGEGPDFTSPSRISVASGFDSGETGSISINTGKLELLHGGLIGADTSGAGRGGEVNIVSRGDVIIDGAAKKHDDDLNEEVHQNFSAIQASTQEDEDDNAGAGGNIRITAGRYLQVSRKGSILAGTIGKGKGGDITISAQHVILSNGIIGVASKDFFTEVTDIPATGNAGSITIEAQSLSLQDRSTLIASADDASGGDLFLHASQVDVVDSSITVAAKKRGGSIAFLGDDRVYAFRSIIDARGKARLGNIDVHQSLLVLNHGQMVTTTKPGGGGNIDIVANQRLQSPDSIITAAGALTIQLANPDTDITSALAQLPASLLASAARLQESCAQRFTLTSGISSFVVEGSGGLPVTVDRPAPSLTLQTPATQPVAP